MKSEYQNHAAIKYGTVGLYLFFVVAIVWIGLHVEPLILALTGLVVVLYTIETRLLRLAADRQNECQMRPAVVMHSCENNVFKVENVGNATALDVSIDPIWIMGKEKIVFPNPVFILRPGEVAEIAHEVTPHKDMRLGAHLSVRFATQETTVFVSFSNVEGKCYRLEELVTNGRVSIKGFRC